MGFSKQATVYNNIGRFGLSLWLMGMIATIACGMMVPIYSDEIAYHMSKANFFRDNTIAVGLFPQCKSQWLTELPLTYYPGALIYSVIYFSSKAFSIRLVGIAVCVTWLIASWFLCHGLIKNKRISVVFIWCSSLAILSFGVLPYTLVLSRPETLMGLCLVIFALFGLVIKATDWPTGKKILFNLIFVSVYSLFLYVHPKAFFFIPYVVLCAFLYVKKKGVLELVFLVLIFGFSLETVKGVFSVTQCPESDYITQLISRHVVDFQQLKTEPFSFIAILCVNFFSSIFYVASGISFKPHYQSSWLAGSDIGFWIKQVLNPVLVLNAVCYCVFITYQTLHLFFSSVVNRWPEKMMLVSLTLLMGVSVNLVVFLPSIWNFYTSSFILMVFSLIGLINLAVNTDNLNKKYFSNYVNAWMIFLSLLSMVAFFVAASPTVYQTFIKGDPGADGQFISAPVLPAKALIDDINALKNQCRLEQNQTRLVIDQITYSFFNSLQQPIFSLYISPLNYGRSIKNLPAFLREINSGGVISKCDYLSNDLRKRAIKRGQYCCLSEQMLDRR